MPRKPIPITQRIESLSVLSPDGKLDKKLEPKISDSDLRKLYKTMLGSRLLDERAFKMQRQGRIGTYPPCKGQEAASLGAAYCLRPDDWMVPAFRENAAMLWRGWPMNFTLFFFGGYEQGAIAPEGVNDTPICVPVASQCQYGMGIAWGLKLQKTDRVSLVFSGDGGTSEGDFHEAMNFAGVYKLPMIMFVQNNHWAISIPREKQTATATIAQKAVAYGFDAIQCDGNDILSVIVAMQEAVERARSGGGPTLIEAVTYRMSVHTTADDPKKYRSDEEVEEWENKDPIPRFKKYLQDKGLLDEKVEQVILEEVNKELDENIAAYEAYEYDQAAFFEHVYENMTPELRAQQAFLRKKLSGELTQGEVADASPDRYQRVL